MKIVATNKSETIAGTNGDDVIWGRGGDDSIWAWKGNDNVHAGSGNDVIGVYAGQDIVDGGDGYDFLNFHYASGGVDIDLTLHAVKVDIGGHTSNTTFRNIEGVYGSRGNDNVLGSNDDNSLFSMDGDDVIEGRGGNDVINAYTGRDEIYGGDDNDTLYVAPGKDTYDGGEGFDTISFNYDKNGVNIAIADGEASFESKAGRGTTVFTSVENLAGSTRNDTLTGDENSNVLGGYDGDDTLMGGGGDDALGGSGGHDQLTGEAGSDGFVFASFKKKDTDIITDFDVAEDWIGIYRDYVRVGARGDNVSDNGQLATKPMVDRHFEANDTGEGSTADSRLIYETDTGILWYDANGSAVGKHHMIAQLDAELALTSSHFFVIV